MGPNYISSFQSSAINSTRNGKGLWAFAWFRSNAAENVKQIRRAFRDWFRQMETCVLIFRLNCVRQWCVKAYNYHSRCIIIFSIHIVSFPPIPVQTYYGFVMPVNRLRRTRCGHGMKICSIFKCICRWNLSGVWKSTNVSIFFFFFARIFFQSRPFCRRRITMNTKLQATRVGAGN